MQQATQATAVVTYMHAGSQLAMGPHGHGP